MENPNTAPATLGQLPGDTLIYKGDRVDLVLRARPTASNPLAQREVCVHPGAVIILPVLADGRFVMIRNRRHTVSQELLELPAGTLEPPEPPIDCARRELVEETGYVAGKLKPFGWFYTSPGILTEKMYAFIATDLSPGKQALEENEQIAVELVSPAEVRRLVAENLIVDAKTLATLLRYML